MLRDTHVSDAVKYFTYIYLRNVRQLNAEWKINKLPFAVVVNAEKFKNQEKTGIYLRRKQKGLILQHLFYYFFKFNKVKINE